MTRDEAFKTLAKVSAQLVFWIAFTVAGFYFAIVADVLAGWRVEGIIATATYFAAWWYALIVRPLLNEPFGARVRLAFQIANLIVAALFAANLVGPLRLVVSELQSWSQGSAIHRLISVAILLALARTLYFLRTTNRLNYGLLEVATGSVFAWHALGSTPSPTSFGTILGAIYVMVRGYDNATLGFAEDAAKTKAREEADIEASLPPMDPALFAPPFAESVALRVAEDSVKREEHPPCAESARDHDDGTDGGAKIRDRGGPAA